jgi:hypothetical protein
MFLSQTGARLSHYTVTTQKEESEQLSRYSDGLRGSTAGRGRRYFSSPQRPDRLCGTPNFLSCGPLQLAEELAQTIGHCSTGQFSLTGYLRRSEVRKLQPHFVISWAWAAVTMLRCLPPALLDSAMQEWRKGAG